MAVSNFMAAGLVVVCIASSTEVQAQESMEADALNAEAAFALARDSAGRGDFQTAIVALERILIVSPELSNIKFELGLLYKRVGALKRALFLLQESLKDPTMPEDVRARAESEIASLNAGSGRSYRLGGHVVVGLQTDSNPSSATDISNLTNSMGDEPSQVSEEVEQDNSVRLSATGFYHRIVRANVDWQNSVSVNGSRYAQQDNLDSSGYTMRSGFRITPKAEESYKAVHNPYVSLSSSGSSQNVSFGVGSQKFSEFWRIGVSGSVGSVMYSEKARAETLDSVRFAVGLSGSFSLFTSNWLDWSANHTSNNAKAEDETFSALSVSVGVSHRNQWAGRPLTLSVSTSLLSREYEGADIVDGVNRSDDTRTTGLSLNVGLSKQLSVRLSGDYRENKSSVRRLRYDNSRAAIDLNWRF